VRVEEGRVPTCRVWNWGGSAGSADVVIDASGVDVAALAGAKYEDFGTTGRVQSLSTLFRLANVDVDRAAETKKAELWALLREAAASGDYILPRLEGSWHRTPYAGIVWSQRGSNVDDGPVALTRRSRARRCSALRPGCGVQASVIVGTNPSISVRESVA
jgi:hypothetical protein